MSAAALIPMAESATAPPVSLPTVDEFPLRAVSLRSLELITGSVPFITVELAPTSCVEPPIGATVDVSVSAIALPDSISHANSQSYHQLTC